MRVATIRTGGTSRAVHVDPGSGSAVETGHPDVGALLAHPDWRAPAEAADGPAHDRVGLDCAPVVPRPGKALCVGVNDAAHVREMGRDLPQYPTLFAKFPKALVGAYDDIVLPAAPRAVDREAELAVVVGATVRHADEAAAERAIAGYAVLNDVTARDWQYRTLQWLSGRTFASTTPFGPVLVTADEAGSGLALSCAVDDETVQQADTADLVFGPAAVIACISTILPPNPGDMVALGTPGGVGHARTPPPPPDLRCGPDDDGGRAGRVPQHLRRGEAAVTAVAAAPGRLTGRWERGEQHLADAVGRVDDGGLAAATLLPGWERARLLAHLAGDADALVNLLTWARTGVETSVRTAQGRTVAATEVLWMRAREVWVHGVDLDTGPANGDIPDDVLAALVDDVVAAWDGRGAALGASVHAAGRQWGSAAPAVRGALPAVAAWLTGRSDGTDLDSDASLPVLAVHQ